MRPALLVVILAVLPLLAPKVALADSTHRLFSRTGSWEIVKTAVGHCVAYARGNEDAVGIDTHGRAVYLELTNSRFQIPAGAYPIGVEMKDFSETRTGPVESGFPHTVAVELNPDDLSAFRRTGWVKFDLGQQWRFMNLDGNEAALRMMSICGHGDRDPFALSK